MSEFDSAQFVSWVVWYANQRDAQLTPIRIVKFLYLLDLYHAREKGGQTITKWEWRFIHYGPFTGAALDAITAAEQRGLIEGIPFQGKFDKETHFFKFVGEDVPEDYSDIFPHYVCSEIKHAVQLWADDTYGLLDYVYFRTEPMINAKPYEVLDFSTACKPKREESVSMLQISKTKAKKARDLLNELKQAQQHVTAEQTISDGPHDEVYLKALQALDENELPGFSGILEL